MYVALEIHSQSQMESITINSSAQDPKSFIFYQLVLFWLHIDTHFPFLLSYVPNLIYRWTQFVMQRFQSQKSGSTSQSGRSQEPSTPPRRAVNCARLTKLRTASKTSTQTSLIQPMRQQPSVWLQLLGRSQRQSPRRRPRTDQIYFAQIVNLEPNGLWNPKP